MHSELYTSSSTVLSVFRMLPELARTYIVRWLLPDDALAKDTFAAWRRHPDDAENVRAIFALKALHIIRERGEELTLHHAFRVSLKRALTGA